MKIRELLENTGQLNQKAMIAHGLWKTLVSLPGEFAADHDPEAVRREALAYAREAFEAFPGYENRKIMEDLEEGS
jgi:hypothetical protein